MPQRTRRLLAGMAAVLVTGMAVAAASTPSPWWKHALILEIYPRSYGDSNGDGVGDLDGITAHLDDVRSLGADAIWIAPMYPSPQVDFGYDISDYRAVDAQYGNLADFDRLLAEAKKRHVRVLLDMVLNHTSDKHAWFIESAGSRQNAKADWYIWNDGVDANAPGVTAFQKRFVHEGKVPPNNWESVFGGSAWEWVPARKQFYYHRFYRQQPDLNWRNPAVEAAMFDAMRFWLDRGVAGFRLDAISTLFEDTRLRNDPSGAVPTRRAIRTCTTSTATTCRKCTTSCAACERWWTAMPAIAYSSAKPIHPKTSDLLPWYGGEHQGRTAPADGHDPRLRLAGEVRRGLVPRTPCRPRRPTCSANRRCWSSTTTTIRVPSTGSAMAATTSPAHGSSPPCC